MTRYISSSGLDHICLRGALLVQLLHAIKAWHAKAGHQTNLELPYNLDSQTHKTIAFD